MLVPVVVRLLEVLPDPLGQYLVLTPERAGRPAGGGVGADAGEPAPPVEAAEETHHPDAAGMSVEFLYGDEPPGASPPPATSPPAKGAPDPSQN